MADNALSREAQDRLSSGFDRVNNDPGYAARVKKYEEILDRLEKTYAGGA